MSVNVDKKICPLCGKPNNCQAQSNKECWCLNIKISPKLLNKIPEDKRGKSCICLSCIEKFNNVKGN